MKQVVFVCSANYYRSRFAEYLFNWLAPQTDLQWRAESRGLLVEEWGYLGPISQHTIDGLQLRGIPINGDNRLPQPLTEDDLENFDLVVAIKEAEHRPLMETKFPEWADLAEYWHIDDLDCAEPEEALPLLEENVRGLIEDLRSHRK